jgi:6-phosphogluconolactonase (cycloisomerase 2 family)
MLLAGCKGFWDPPPSTSTTTTTPTTLSSGVFYVLNQTSGQIVAYDISSGTLNKIGAYAIAGPTAMAIAPNGNFLYVSTLASGIFVYDIGSGGALTPGNSGGSVSGELASAIQVDPSGLWLIDAYTIGAVGSYGLQVDAIPITASGTLDNSRTEQIPNNLPSFTNASANGMVISPDGKNVFVAAGEAGTVAIPFSSGSASPLAASSTHTFGPLHALGADLSVAVDPSSTPRLFYIGETNVNSTGALRVFDYSTLAEASYSPIASGGLAPSAILPIASGQYVYVANGQSTNSKGNVAWFPVTASGTTYTVTVGSTIASGVQPTSLAEDSKGNFVLAVSTGGNPDLEAYTISSGALTSAITSTTGTDPVGAVAVAALP